MTRQIFSEGRVVGYSAYEIFVRQFLNSGGDPAGLPSEKQWLASSIAMGSSMILRLSSSDNGELDDNRYQYITIPLPKSSTIAAANTIVGSFFDGDVKGSNRWASSVTDYGSEITKPTSGTYTTTDTMSIPTQSSHKDNTSALLDYMKIVDGVIMQPGTWYDGTDTKAGFKPNLAAEDDSRPVVRLYVRGRIESSVNILLTGFTLQSVLAGSVSSEPDESFNGFNGDLLGPSFYPWANKIVFSIPTSYYDSIGVSGNYDRTINSVNHKVNDAPVIDLKQSNFPTSKGDITYNVNDFSTTSDGLSILTVYNRSTVFPPGLYGSYVTQDGECQLQPIGDVSEGSIRVVPSGTITDYQNAYPGTVAITKSEDGMLSTDKGPVAQVTASNGSATITVGTKPVSISTSVSDFDGTNGLSLNTTIGGITRRSISLTNKDTSSGSVGSDLPVTGASGARSISYKLTWRDLLYALRNNRYIDLSSIFLGLGMDVRADSASGKIVLDTTSRVSKDTDLTAGVHYNVRIGNAVRPYNKSSGSFPAETTIFEGYTQVHTSDDPSNYILKPAYNFLKLSLYKSTSSVRLGDIDCPTLVELHIDPGTSGYYMGMKIFSSDATSGDFEDVKLDYFSFAFKHTSDWTDTDARSNLSILFGIEFLSNSGYLTKLFDPDYYSISSQNSWNIWNISGASGASWQANTNIAASDNVMTPRNGGTVSYKTSIYSKAWKTDLMCYANQYADGHNTQIDSVWGRNCQSTHLNGGWVVTFILKKFS